MAGTPENIRAAGILSAVINGAIFLITLVLVVFFFRKDGKWNAARGKRIFRNFTCQSNVLCAAAALAMCVAQLAGDVPRWVWVLKYLGTVTVTVTLLTVLLLAAFGMDSMRKLLAESDFFMHLVTPVLAIASFCGLERQPISFGTAMLGLIPVALYGARYIYKILLAPEGKRWEDRYGLNRNWKWPVSCSVMMGGTFAVCVVMMLLLNTLD